MGTLLTAALKAPANDLAEVITADTFDEIVRQHQRRVYRVILLLLRDPDTADTLTQECFLRAYNGRERFRGECSVSTWLIRIAVNLVRDHARSRRASFWKKLIGLDDDAGGETKVADFASADPSPERALLAREALKEVWAAVDSLSDQQRTIFLLRYAEEMQLTEIAETLNLSVGAVKTQLSRATGKIRVTVKEK